MKNMPDLEFLNGLPVERDDSDEEEESEEEIEDPETHQEEMYQESESQQ